MSKRSKAAAGDRIELYDALVRAGLEPHLATLLNDMPRKSVEVDPRRPFREAGVERNEVFFVESGILAKYKGDGAGRRQIIALRFAGDGILPGEGVADYGIHAIVRSRVLVGQQRHAQSFWICLRMHCGAAAESSENDNGEQLLHRAASMAATGCGWEWDEW